MKTKYLIVFFIFFIIFFKYTYIGKKINNILDFFLFVFYTQFKSFEIKLKNKNFKNFTNSLIKKNNTKIIKNKKSSEISKSKTIFLVNHRSWADFWIDYTIFEGVYISRKEVQYVLPFSSKLALKNNTIIFFDRNVKSKKGKKKLYDDIKNNLNSNKNIILYPEGTRNTSNKSKPLKFGIIKLGYQENVPFQICIVSNKEKVLNEKKLSIGKNINCEYFTSEIIHPKDYKTLEEFVDVIQKKWDESWNVIYNNV